MSNSTELTLGILFPIYGIYLLASGSGKKKDGMSQSISDFQVTHAEEGQCVPITYGDCYVNGSVIWYGNVRYKNIKAKGAKGSGGDASSSGYRAFCDCHLVLCEGKISLLGIYKDKELYNLSASSTFNDGTTSDYVAYGEYATKLKGVAHLHLASWYLGDNTNTIPSLRFKVRRLLTTPLTNTVDASKGENPACIIYDLITKAGGTCDLVSFNLAAQVFNTAQIGLNLVFDSQEDVSKHIEKVLEHVDLAIYRNNGIYYLRTLYSYGDTWGITDVDMTDFIFSRDSYINTTNDFSATYKDTNDTERTVRLMNEAAIDIAGGVRNKSYDMEGYNNVDSVRYRLSEILQKNSYPASRISFTAPLKYYTAEVGDVVRVTHDLYGLTSCQFTVTKVSKNLFENKISIEATERPDYLADGFDFEAGTPGWVEPDHTPVDLTEVKVVQVKYGKHRNGNLHVLVLPVKELGVEQNYDLYFSRDDLSYTYVSTLSSFAEKGVLEEDYPDTTYDIDDEKGILVDYDETNFPLDNLTRSELFLTKRMVVLGEELLKFQTATEESGNMRLTGVLRDDKQAHSIGEKLFICEISDNILEFPISETLYFKLCPRTVRGVLDIADATTVSFTPDYTPDKPARLKATRSGSDIILEVWPNANKNFGYGIGDPGVVTDTIPHPFKFEGTILYTIGSNPEFASLTSTYSFTDAAEVTISVRQQAYGFYSESLTLVVGTDDGEYIV